MFRTHFHIVEGGPDGGTETGLGVNSSYDVHLGAVKLLILDIQFFQNTGPSTETRVEPF